MRHAAARSHNGQLSHLLSLIINEVTKEYDALETECRSTEEMISTIETIEIHRDHRDHHPGVGGGGEKEEEVQGGLPGQHHGGGDG